MLKVGINGFGRIGRLMFRSSWKQHNSFQVVAVNDLADNATLAHLLKYDSNYGIFEHDVSVKGDNLTVDGKEIRVLSEKDPARLPWKELGVDVVIEATGIFRARKDAAKHLDAGAGKVVVSAPAGDADIMTVLGVNEEKYQPDKHHVISNASCTTNALAPVAKVLQDNFGLRKGLMNTTHAYTNDQVIMDQPHSDLRRARGGAVSIIPTSTGAAKAVGKVIPELNGVVDGFAVRVPTATVSLVDLVAELEKEVTSEEINRVFQKEAEKSKVLDFNDEPLVSADYKGNPYSSVVDGISTMVVGGNMARVVAWYDNEWAYSCRVGDLVDYMASKA